jgi:hypothetical protein
MDWAWMVSVALGSFLGSFMGSFAYRYWRHTRRRTIDVTTFGDTAGRYVVEMK